MLSVRLNEELEAQVKYVAKISKRSKSSIVTQILKEHLDDLQDYYLALQAIEEHKKSGERMYTLDEARKELGLDDE